MKIMTTIEGTLAAAARSGTTNDGTDYANFRVAVGHARLDRDTGEYVETGTSWFDVSAYGRLAKNAAFCLRKGDKVVVVGELRMRDWDNGQKTGTSGSLKAQAIGHDLKFGITTLTKNQVLDGSVGAATTGHSADDAGAAADGTARSWGLTSDPGAERYDASSAGTDPADPFGADGYGSGADGTGAGGIGTEADDDDATLVGAVVGGGEGDDAADETPPF